MSLFLNVKYHLSSSLSPDHRAQMTLALETDGATPSDSINDATHIITDSLNFEGWQETTDAVAIVTIRWVERSIVLGKLQPTEYYSADPNMLFSGMVACAAELPSTDLEVLDAGITGLGGQWRTALTRDVTHLFTNSTTSDKYETAMHYKEHTHIKVLLPHWFDDAVRLGLGTLSTGPYEYPDPEFLRPSTKDAGDDKDDPGPSASVSKNRKWDADKKTFFKTALWSPGANVPNLNVKAVWEGRRVLLSTTLELTGGRREAVKIGIQRAKGVVIDYDTREGDGTVEEEIEKVDDCDVFVTRYRSGKAYFKAVRANKTIGTLPWVFNVQTTGVLSRPMNQLLHYPVPKKPIEGFSDHEITITNYTGEAREYLKKLIQAMGAKFTPSMSGRNTVLIAAYIRGTKTTKAASWSIPIVNHAWLEDCFIKWRSLTVGIEKYVRFPPGVDFAAMLGERGVGRAVEDLEELEEEEEEEEEEARVPTGTENSARDVREVTALIEADLDGDVFMDGNLGANADMEGDAMDLDAEEVTPQPKPVSKGKSKVAPRARKARSPSPKATVKASSSAKTRTNNSSTRKARAPTDDSEDEEVPAVAPPRRLLRGAGRNSTTNVDVDDAMDGGRGNDSDVEISPTKTSGARSSKKEPQSKAKKTGKPRESTSDLDIESIHSLVLPAKLPPSTTTKTQSGRKGRGKAPVQDIDSDDLPEIIEPMSPKSADRKGKGKGRAIPVEENDDSDDLPEVLQPVSPRSPLRKSRSRQVIVDEDSDDLPEAIEPKQKRPSKGRSTDTSTKRQSNKGAAAMTAPTPVQTSPTRSQPKAGPTPKRQISVVVPTLKSVNASRSNTGPAKEPLGRTESLQVAAAEERRRETSRTSTSPSKVISIPPISVAESSSSRAADTSTRGSKRAAATKATQRLKDEIMPDVMNYQAEVRNHKSRKSNGDSTSFVGRHKRTSELRSEAGDGDVGEDSDAVKPVKKRKSAAGDKNKEDADTGEEDSARDKKRRKTGKEASVVNDAHGTEDGAKEENSSRKISKTITLMTTQVNLSDDVIKTLNRLGVKLTTRWMDCTHLLAPHIVRTEKFLCALAKAPFILEGKWALESAAANKLLPEAKYLLQDKANEAKYGFKLSESLARAKTNANKLFAHKTFYVTPKISIDLKLLKNVAAACGGQVLTQTPNLRTLQAKPDRYIISCPADRSIWGPIAQHYPIYTHELLLTAALKQVVEWDNESFKVEGSF